MSLNMNQKRCLLEAIEYIDDAMISDTMSRVKTDAVTAGMPSSKKHVIWIKQVAVLAACALLLGAIIPVISFVSKNTNPFGGFGAGANPGVEETEPLPEVVETEPPEHDGSKGLIYEVNEDGKTVSFVSYGTCTDEVVYIASTYNGMPVTRMYNKGYWDAEYIPADHDFNSKYLKHLVISDTVEFVDLECIRQCPNIESVYYGASVEIIHELPFPGDNGANFSKVEVSPENPYYSDKGNCIVDLRTKALVVATPTTVIPDDGSVAIIGVFAYGSARSVKSVVIPEGVKIIDRHAFDGCMELESVVLPDSIEVVESMAFHFCKSLKTLTFGNNLVAFSLYTFHDKYCPKVYYKGTVVEWEEVNKTRAGNAENLIPVICSDGESKTNSGKHGVYHWQYLPEYEAYWNQVWPGIPQPDWDPEYAGEEMTVN